MKYELKNLRIKCRAFGNTAVRHPWLVLGIIYITACALRAFFTFASGDIPAIMNDEIIYLHAGRSLYESGEILFRGQPMLYRSILYPLFTGLLFYLPDEINLYRAVQLMNILLMSATIFPAYALSRELKLESRHCLLVAALCLILPDVAIVRYAMAEPLGYPLIMAELLIVIRALNNPKSCAHWLGVAAMSILLYMLKPGYITLGICAAAVLLIYVLKTRDREALLSFALCAATMMLGYMLYRVLLRSVFSVDLSMNDLYASQTADFSISHIIQTIDGIMRYSFFELIAFGFIPVALAFSLISRISDARKQFMQVLLLTFFVTMLGTVYIVYADELNNFGGIPLRIHTRYTAMLFPVFIMLLFMPDSRDISLAKPICVLGTLELVWLACYGVKGFSHDFHYTVDSMLMAGLGLKIGAWQGLTMYLPICCGALSVCAVYALKNGLTVRFRRVFTLVTIIMLALNSYAAYVDNLYNRDAELVADANQAIEQTGGEAIIVYTDGNLVSANAIAAEMAGRMRQSVVSYGELIEATDENGVLQPFMPKAFERFMNTVPDRVVMPKSGLIIDSELGFLFASSTGINYTENKRYGVVQCGEQPWIHSGLVGFNSRWVKDGSQLRIYDPTLRSRENLTVYLYSRAGEGTAMLNLIMPDGKNHQIQLTDELEWYTVEFELPHDAKAIIEFENVLGEVYVETYRVG